jgi:hypothetical protein
MAQINLAQDSSHGWATVPQPHEAVNSKIRHALSIVALLTTALKLREESVALRGPDRAACRVVEAALKAFFAVQ